MLSKKSKILTILLSLAIVGSLVTPVLAAQYSHQYYVEGWGSAPLGGLMKYFKVTAKLDVTTSNVGLPHITSYTKSYSFWSEGHLIIFPFYLYYYKFVNVVQTTVGTYIWTYQQNLVALYYSVEGKVQSTFDSSNYVMVKVWVKIWADGSKDGGFDIWDDNLGMLYFGP
ncbi:MAG: hypothetical protein ACFFBH_16195 [Promethearchaeota archaeon]